MKKHIPNTITALNLISGCIAVQCALLGDPLYCAIFIVLSAIFDFFDGFVARLLKVSSDIGKELDSLADVVSFGFAPAALVYDMFRDYTYPESMFWIAPYLPYVAFIIAAFSAIRLAKFNVDTRQTCSFIGMPTPANALLIIGIANSPQLVPLWTTPIWGLVFLFSLIGVTSFLLVCELPMFSLKTQSKFPLVFAICALLITVILLCLGCGLLGLTISMVYYIISSFILSFGKE